MQSLEPHETIVHVLSLGGGSEIRFALLECELGQFIDIRKIRKDLSSEL